MNKEDTAAPLPRPLLSIYEKNSIPILTDVALYEATGIRIGFTSRKGGVSVGRFESFNIADYVDDDLSAVSSNQRLLLDAFDLPKDSLFIPKQIHSNKFIVVDSNDKHDIEQIKHHAIDGADAVIVDRGITSCVPVVCCADCVPIVIVSNSNRFACVHSGWRGTLACISRRVALAVCMLDLYGSIDESLIDNFDVCGGQTKNEILDAMGNLNVYIGPHIHSECFEVSSDVASKFCSVFGNCVVGANNKLSMSNAIVTDLTRFCVLPNRIVDADICTACNSDTYFSYRATDGCCGRQVAFAAIQQE